jgi:RHS repeat-associated protein
MINSRSGRHGVSIKLILVVLFCTLAPCAFGSRVAKSANGTTTQYLVDDLSPTGYPQVVEELTNGAVTRTYTYGLERISQLQTIQGALTASFYQYDGRGTVRMLTNAAGAVTDAYEYDAFGNLIAQTGSTPNAYLYRGERYDSDLGLYYLRARWYNPVTGRFMSRDPYEGSIYDPASLHRYNYARANPVNYIDPSGRSNLTEYALDLSLNTIATAGVVTSLGFSVKCAYFTVASSVHLVGETLGQQVDQFTPLFKSCAAKITTTQFVTAWAANTALLALNVFAGPALTAVGDWMFGAEQGMDWRLLTEEEGSFGPRGRSPFLSGRPSTPPLRGNAENVRGILRENQTAEIMADNDYYVEQNPNVPGPKNPDYRIEGETCDCYAPSTGNVQHIWDTMAGKISSGQAGSLVVNLADSTVTPAELEGYLANNPIPGMQSLFIIDQSGTVIVYP